MNNIQLPKARWGVYGWLNLTVTFKDGQKIDLHGKAAIDFIGQLQRGGWKIAEPEKPQEIK